MVEVERQGSGSGQNIIEIMARFLLGQIKRENMDENNQAIFSYYMQLMDDDPGFREKVYSKKNELTVIAKDGRKIPLYTDEELAKAKRHRRKKKTSFERAFQSGLFKDAVRDNEITGIETILDPEKGLARLHSELQGSFSWNKNSLIAKEVQQKTMELRDIISLPVARGKDIHINDDFYKFLVRRVVKFDTFGVFGEFDRMITEIHPELDLKINQVKGIIGELLNDGLNLRERHQRFNHFAEEFREKWGE